MSTQDRSTGRARAKGAGRAQRKGPAVVLLGFGLLVLLGAYGAALSFLRPQSPGQEVSLNTLTRDAICAAPTTTDPANPTADKTRAAYCRDVHETVTTARFLDEDARITGSIEYAGGGGTQYWVSYPRSDAATADLLRDLTASPRTDVTVDPQTVKQVVRFVVQYLLPLVILAALFGLIFSLIQGGGSRSGTSEFLRFGRLGDRRAGKREKEGTTFADVAAADEVIAELAEVRDYLADPSTFAAMGALPPKGVLLFGPPGCGKTLLARAVAGEAKASFFSISGSEFVEVLVGVGASRVRDLFRQARAHAPSIVFIDEIDGVGRQRGAGFGQGHDEREQTLNELLTQMDGFSPSEGVVVMGATNRPDILDRALMRAGRFDRHITLERPDLQGRLAILRLHAQGRRLSDADHDLPHVARTTPGFTGADLANLLNEAALLAVRERAGAITGSHLQEAVDRVLTGPRRRGQIMSVEERRAAAYHESGHTVVAAALGRGPRIDKVSIIARGRGVGHLAMLQEERTLLRRSDMEVQIAIALGGYAAETLVFGEPSTGSEQDVERATLTARDMAGRYAMSARLGPMRLLQSNREVFLGRDYLATQDVSQPTMEHLDEEVRRILEEQTERARSILQGHRSVLDALASALISRETLQGADLARALSAVEPRLEVMATGDGPARG